MNIYTAVTIIDVAIISMVGLGIYVTHELWPLFALFFMVTFKDDK